MDQVYGGHSSKSESVPGNSKAPVDDRSMFDIDGPNFNPDLYMQHVVERYNLNELIDMESSIIKQIQDLDSAMQTLVYENYNKFILATDTIRKMRTDFREMEDKMSLLSTNISKITDSSLLISENLRDKREKVSKLSGVHELLKKLKFLFELPNKLKTHYKEKNLEEAVSCYLNGVEFLDEFKGFSSLEAIKQDCSQIVCEVTKELYLDFDDAEKVSQDLTRNVALLLSLGEDPLQLGAKFLGHSLPKLKKNLESLDTASSPNVPLEEFMELGCGVFLSNLSLLIASFLQAFVQPTLLMEEIRQKLVDNLVEFTQNLMERFLRLNEQRLSLEVDSISASETEMREMMIKSLDRLYRRMVAMGTLMPQTDFSPSGIELVFKIASRDAELSLKKIQTSFSKAVLDSSNDIKAHPTSSQEVLGSILATFVLQIKSSLSKIQDYCKPELQFSQNIEFRQRIAVANVRERLIIGAFNYLVEFGENIVSSPEYDNHMWLLLAKLYFDVRLSTVDYIVTGAENEFEMKASQLYKHFPITNVSEIKSRINMTGINLVQEFVSHEGSKISEMIKSTVLSRDLFLFNEEPSGPQPQLKAMVDNLGKLEKFLDCIFPDPELSIFKSERSSDSSRRSTSTLQGKHMRPSFSSNFDPNITANIQKLFSDKIEIFGFVESNKSDILMSIVKIALRAFMEHTRLKTISNCGLHQIQVDVCYLQLYLWRFVSNETFLHSLLDEIIVSSIQRCIQPNLLEPSVVEKLAEK